MLPGPIQSGVLTEFLNRGAHPLTPRKAVTVRAGFERKSWRSSACPLSAAADLWKDGSVQEAVSVKPWAGETNRMRRGREAEWYSAVMREGHWKDAAWPWAAGPDLSGLFPGQVSSESRPQAEGACLWPASPDWLAIRLLEEVWWEAGVTMFAARNCRRAVDSASGGSSRWRAGLRAAREPAKVEPDWQERECWRTMKEEGPSAAKA